MHGLEAVLFGAVQGLAEFLPISSSGHLLLLHSITNFQLVDDLAFDVALHLGTLVALLAFFWRDVIKLATAGWDWLRRPTSTATVDQKMVGWLMVGSIPAVIAGMTLETYTETSWRSPILVASALMVAGLILWAVDVVQKGQKGIDQLSWWRSLLIGVGQALALVPGVSRSGATIIAGRLLGLNREAAARFSFLLSIPIVAAAGAKKSMDLVDLNLTVDQGTQFILGGITAAVVGYFAIRILLRYVSRHSYTAFAVYRIAVGAAALIYFWPK